MPYIYSSPEREADPHALPDVEVFHLSANEFLSGGHDDALHDIAADIGQMLDNVRHMRWFRREVEASLAGWYWRVGFPGCMPDGEPVGPYDSQEEAEAAAREAPSEYGNRNGGAAFDDMCD